MPVYDRPIELKQYENRLNQRGTAFDRVLIATVSVWARVDPAGSYSEPTAHGSPTFNAYTFTIRWRKDINLQNPANVDLVYNGRTYTVHGITETAPRRNFEIEIETTLQV